MCILKKLIFPVLLLLSAGNSYASIENVEPRGASVYNFPANSGRVLPVTFSFTVTNTWNQNIYLTDAPLTNSSPALYLHYTPKNSTCSLYAKDGNSTKPLEPNATCILTFSANVVPAAVGDYSHNQFTLEDQLGYSVLSGFFGIKVG